MSQFQSRNTANANRQEKQLANEEKGKGWLAAGLCFTGLEG